MDTPVRTVVSYQGEDIGVDIFPPRHTHYGKTFYPVSLEGEQHTIERDKAGKWLCKSIGKELCNKIVKQIETLNIRWTE